LDRGNRPISRTYGARCARPALRIGFPSEIPQIISATNHFLAHSGSRCRRIGRIGADAEEKNLRRLKEQPKIKKETCRNRSWLGGAKNRSRPGAAGGCRAGKKTTHRFWRALASQNMSGSRLVGRQGPWLAMSLRSSTSFFPLRTRLCQLIIPAVRNGPKDFSSSGRIASAAACG